MISKTKVCQEPESLVLISLTCLDQCQHIMQSKAIISGFGTSILEKPNGTGHHGNGRLSVLELSAERLAACTPCNGAWRTAAGNIITDIYLH